MTAPKVSMLSVEESIRRIRNLGYDEAFGELSVFRILLQNEKVVFAVVNGFVYGVNGSENGVKNGLVE